MRSFYADDVFVISFASVAYYTRYLEPSEDVGVEAHISLSNGKSLILRDDRAKEFDAQYWRWAGARCGRADG